MKNFLFLLCFFLSIQVNAQKKPGYFNYEWVDSSGVLLLELPESRIGESFLYVNSLTAGVGSNDLGLDRGQLGDERVVKFYRSGKKILLIEENLKFRALSDNAEEVRSVQEAFAQSVVWSFDIKSKAKNNFYVDMTGFLLRDAHGVASRLNNKKQGSYKLDKSKSVVYPEGLFNFPKNTEFEALLTFAGDAKGEWIKSVAPNAKLVSVRLHHSFIELPDSNYTPRLFHPESGLNAISFYDYANPIGEDMTQRWITRHRLEKKNPNAGKSEAKEPIIYYLDPGCPEPVRTALMEGGKWWNQAFEAAGFINAFQIKDLPKGAHPLDVRYNMIQWVHRSTRGWSYGSSIKDPRTGEILKGHVSLGSLRVRQDFMIAQGIISNFNERSDDPRMLEMSLARLRQLSAHEIGHTIGLAHNFAASHNDRSSVMDYPHPYVILDANGKKNFNEAYAVGIGEWDKRAIIFGYAYAPKGVSESDYLNGLIEKNRADGLKFITDQDSRSPGGMHPHSHLWDNGSDPVIELERLSKLRGEVLNNLGSNSIAEGLPFSEIEKLLVPAYLMNRYQVDAISKIIGGVDFSYGVKSKGQMPEVKMIPIDRQEKALNALLTTLDVNYLKLPEELLSQIPPPAFGYPRDRETFKGKLGSLFDPLSAAEASANNTLLFLLNPERLARIQLQEEGSWTLATYLSKIVNHVVAQTNYDEDYQIMLEKLVYIHLLKLASDDKISKQVSAAAFYQLNQFTDSMKLVGKVKHKAHVMYLQDLINKFKTSPESFALPSLPSLPPGSPIGCY